jgi:hypothetical protein
LDELVGDFVLLFSSGIWVRVSGARGFGFFGLPCLGDSESWSFFHDLARLRDRHDERNEHIDRMKRVRNIELEFPNSRVLRSCSIGDHYGADRISGPQTHSALAPHHRVTRLLLAGVE